MQQVGEGASGAGSDHGVLVAPRRPLPFSLDGTPPFAAHYVPRSRVLWLVFLGTPRSTPQLLWAAAEWVSLRLLTEANASAWAANGYGVAQAHVRGPTIGDVAEAVSVFDALDNKLLGHGPRLPVPFMQAETWLLRYSLIPCN